MDRYPVAKVGELSDGERKVCGTRLPSFVYEYEYGREKEILRCPWRGWEFDLLTGEHLVDPDTRLRRGKLELGNWMKNISNRAGSKPTKISYTF